MKVTFLPVFFATVFSSIVFAGNNKAQDVFEKKISLHVQNESLKSTLSEIEKKIDVRFVYSDSKISLDGKVNAKFRDEKLGKVLEEILEPYNVNFRSQGNNKYIVLVPKLKSASSLNSIKDVQILSTQQTSKVRGKVLNAETKEPMPGVNVILKSIKKGTVTNSSGDFELDVPENGTLSFSFIGYLAEDVTINGQTFIKVLMTEDITSLGEVKVVSTGYQKLPKERATGAFGTISANELARTSSPNVLQRLEGLVAGMQVLVTAGDRTFDYYNTTKGINSPTHTAGSTDYNLNIRGVSTINGENFPLLVVDGAITEMDISNFNPDDIENITVLKDAAAASIYGVRAANGVIVINTKRGKNDIAPQINFSTNLMFAEKPDLGYIKTMNSAQQLDYEKELVDRGFIYSIPASSYYNASYVFSKGTNLALALKAGSITQTEYDAQVKTLSAIDNKSQISKYLLQKAQSQNYNISISGGSTSSNYYYSASYSKEEPNTVRNYGQRLTLTANNNWKLFNWATLSTSLKGTFFKYVTDGISLNSLYKSNQYTLMPYDLLADENGNGISYNRYNPTWTSTLSSAYKDWTYNYLDELKNADNTQKNDNYIATINLQVPIYKGLSASAQYSIERTYSKQRIYYNQDTYYMRNILNYFTSPTATTNSLGITNGGALSVLNTNENNYNLRAQLDYDYTFAEMHHVTALAGTELRETNMGQGGETLWGYNPTTGYTDTNIDFNTSDYNYATVAGYNSGFYYGGYPYQYDKRRRFLSYYGNAAYTLMDKYTATASVRYDDYNNFGLDRKYRATPLWSSGLKWIVSKEAFMQNIAWVNNFDIRASYGVNGNLSLSTYPYTAIYMSGSDYTTGQSYAGISSPANPELKWEKVYNSNLGFDFTLFNRRLNGTFDVYRKNSKDLLYAFPISAVYVGSISTTLTQNAASMINKGVDLGLNGTLLVVNEFQWNLGGTFSYNTNKITDTYFNESKYTSYYGYYPFGIGLLSGYPQDKLLVYRNAGLDENGLTQVYDEDGNKIKATQTSITSFGVFKNVGRTTAPYYGNINTTLKYKGFSLYALFTYKFGSVFLKPSINNYITSAYRTNYDLSADIAKRWKKIGDENTTDVPGLNGTSTAITYSLYRYMYSDINVLKGDYIRFRQLSLSYQIPDKFISKYHIKGAQISVSANNLGLLWTANKQGYDPDYVSGLNSYSLPPSRSYTFSLNLNF
jgi:TonB-linked SusC/RagA family outer membrane protein